MLATAFLAATLAAAPPIPLDAARRAFDEARIASEEDNGKLWGRPLYGPMIFVDPQTRFAVADRADEKRTLKADHGVFTGTLPPDVIIANTATNWNGTRWTMVMWQSVGSSTVSRRRLLLHESFHRIQDDLGLPQGDGDNAHLDTLDGRYWFLLELRALSAALRNENRNAAIADALAFRAKRRALFEKAAAAETALEDNEGLAEYTGYALRGTGPEETRLRMARILDTLDRNDSFVRGFAYSSGPAYGLLLDALSPGWTRTFKRGDDMAATLGAAAKVTAGDADARAAAYGASVLRAQEEKRDRDHRELLARLRARLVDGPTLELPMGQFGFDPNAVIPLGKEGNAHPSLDVSGPWGTIHADEGARITADYSAIVVSASDREKLKLNAGWKVVPGVRPGDLRVTPE